MSKQLPDDVTYLLRTDIPNDGFAPSFAAWHRMILNSDRYICQHCGKKIPVKWKIKSGRKVASNYGHHIISQTLARWFDRNEIRILLANGISYCDDCHYAEHKRLGNYEDGGATQAFNNFVGLENLSGTNSIYRALEFQTFDKAKHHLYKLLIKVITHHWPDLRQFIEDEDYEDKAAMAFCAIFYSFVYEELVLLDWKTINHWKRSELLKVVEVANEKWKTQMKYLAQEYYKHQLIKK